MKLYQVRTGYPELRIRDVYPGSGFCLPGSRVKRHQIPVPTKKLRFLTQKICSRILIFFHPGSRIQGFKKI
jgi:hypothetical protein